ncbi:hypothetical protein ABK040_007061 [Willaertia magna]
MYFSCQTDKSLIKLKKKLLFSKTSIPRKKVKFIVLNNRDSDANTKKEFKFITKHLDTLNSCPNIVHILDSSFETTKARYLLPRYDSDMQYCLETHPNSVLSLRELCTLILHVSTALVHLRNNNIFHGDIKPKNILKVHELSGNRYALTDFGFSRKVEETTTMSLFGTANYCPPELINEEKGSVKGDIWSFGVTVLSLLSGEEPKELWDYDEQRKKNHT